MTNVRGLLQRRAWCGPCAAALGLLFLPSCGNAPVFEAVATAHTGKEGATGLTIPVPASASGAAAGDLLVAVLGVKINPSTAGPGGWTPVSGMAGFNGATCASDQEGIACQLTVYYKIAVGNENNAAFGWATIRQAAGAVLRYSNVDQGAPIGATAKQNGSSATPTAPAVTTTRDESRLLRVALSEADDAGNQTSSELLLGGEPPTFRFNLFSFPPASAGVAMGCGPPISGCGFTSDAVGLAGSDARQTTMGTSGTASWTMAAGDQWVAVTIEIKRPPDTPVVVQ